MSRLFDLECALTESQGITKQAKYIDLMEITSKLSGLADHHGLLEEMEEALDNVREHMNKLQSAIFQCDEVFENAVREEWYREDEE
tara:strand:+ start:416 stop:673 length:258 start_codon:yes stop_codon:yes gene_type:complete